jgi:hypothetical protein
MTDEPLDEKLRRTWFSTLTAAQAAAELGMKTSDLNNHWRRLRLEGKLPARGRQPSENQSDGRPSVNEYGDDPLGDALARGKGHESGSEK